MNRTPPSDVDLLLTDFFRNELPKPWPAAPATAVASPPPRRDPGRRARYTLAASVAALAGACWLLSAGGPRPLGAGANGRAEPDVLPAATARTPTDKAKAKAAATGDPMHGFQPGALPVP